MQPMERCARLADNAVHRRLRRQRVARDRDIQTMGERPFGNEAEAILGVALPIAAMEEQQRRGGGAVRGEEVEPRTRRITIDQIEMIRRARAKRLAAAQPISEISVAATATELLYAASSACRSIEP